MAERKKYIEVNVPILNSDLRVLGTAEQLHDKTIKIDMTRRMRGKGLTITLRVFNQDGKLIALPNKMELVKSYIRRMMRKRTDYVEDSFSATCADVQATIKPLLITRKRVSRAVRKNLRNTAKEFLTEYVKDKDYNDLCEELRMGILQKTLLPKLKKVYPLSFCDIRVFETKEIAKVDIEKILQRKQEEAEQMKIEKENTDKEEINEQGSNENEKDSGEDDEEEKTDEEDSSDDKDEEKEEVKEEEIDEQGSGKTVKKAAKKAVKKAAKPRLKKTTKKTAKKAVKKK